MSKTWNNKLINDLEFRSNITSETWDCGQKIKELIGCNIALCVCVTKHQINIAASSYANMKLHHTVKQGVNMKVEQLLFTFSYPL